jgi:hypothetical protein
LAYTPGNAISNITVLKEQALQQYINYSSFATKESPLTLNVRGLCFEVSLRNLVLS